MVYHLLTDRQAQLLRLHCEGKTVPEIAAAMGTSLGLAKMMRRLVKIRLRIDSMDEICRMAEAGESPPVLFRRPIAPR